MSKIKFGQRLIRGIVYGIASGGVIYMVVYILATAVNHIANSNVLDQTGLSLLGLGLGMFAGIGIELSKDFEESEKK